jgi:hypothetical protein
MQQTFCALLIATTLAAQSTSPSDWVGVWQGELDEIPSVVLTVAQDNGSLEGTLVLNIITRDGTRPHIVAHEPHTLMQPEVHGARLSFRLKRIDGSSAPMNFSVELTSADRARFIATTAAQMFPSLKSPN